MIDNRLVTFHYRYSTSRRVLGCRVLTHGTVVRNPESKWWVILAKFQLTHVDEGWHLGTFPKSSTTEPIWAPIARVWPTYSAVINYDICGTIFHGYSSYG